MANAQAKTKYIRISPRKARLAADLIRGKGVDAAAVQLQFCKMKAGRILGKTLQSAIANAETQLNVQRGDLIVKEVRVDCGPILKRSKPKNRGGSHPIMKRTSHFTVIVAAE
ncbi:MAG: 50S ribosomal protein L22 [Verrucomicrobia bacterium]|nr:50S ribosomal protein L22 [Verrucomicrobiota bacterium]